MSQDRDANGRFTKRQKAESVAKAVNINSAPAGETGLKRSYGYIYEEFLRELEGPRAMRVYKEMRDNDPVIGAIFFAIEMYMRRVQWFVDAPDDDPQGEQKAQHVRECKQDMSHTWSDFISEVMSMMEYGWSYFECLYKIRTTDPKLDENGQPTDEPQSKYNDGKVGWRKFEIRSQDSLEKWGFDKEGGLTGLYQRPAPDYEEHFIPIQKALLFRTTTKKNNPEGRSVLRNAYRPWYFKKRIEEIEGVGIERDLAGLPFAEVPAEMMRPDASDADKATLQSIVDLVKNVRRDEQEGVVWPQSWDENGTPQYQFKLMSSGGSRQFDTNGVIGRYEQRMAMVVLADFILLGSDSASNSSFAFATNKSGLFQSALTTWLDVIQDVLNMYAIPRLMRLNGFSAPYPKFRHDEVQKPSLADLATFVSALVGAGAPLFPDVDLENHFRHLAQLPLRKADPQESDKEKKLREDKLTADIAAQEFEIKNPAVAFMRGRGMGGGGMGGAGGGGNVPGGAGGNRSPLGKQPGSQLGAPTKSTGKVKSKLPPQSRRRTASVNAAENVKKRRVVKRRIKK